MNTSEIGSSAAAHGLRRGGRPASQYAGRFAAGRPVLLLLAMATRHLDERVADDVVLEDPENRVANRPLRGERRRGRWTLRGASHRLLRRASASSALRPREGTISPVDPSPTDLTRSQAVTGAQRAANGEAPAPTEFGLLAGGKTARRAGVETSGDDGLSALRHYSHIHANSELAKMHSQIRMMLPIIIARKLAWGDGYDGPRPERSQNFAPIHRMVQAVG